MFGLEIHPKNVDIEKDCSNNWGEEINNQAVVSFQETFPEKMLKSFYCYITEGANIMPDSSNFVQEVICCNSPIEIL